MAQEHIKGELVSQSLALVARQ